jgi:hypothetical protein
MVAPVSASLVRFCRRAASLASVILLLYSSLCGMFGPLIASKPLKEEVGLFSFLRLQLFVGITVTCWCGINRSSASGTAVEHADGVICVVPCGKLVVLLCVAAWLIAIVGSAVIAGVAVGSATGSKIGKGRSVRSESCG